MTQSVFGVLQANVKGKCSCLDLAFQENSFGHNNACVLCLSESFLTPRCDSEGFLLSKRLTYGRPTVSDDFRALCLSEDFLR